MQILLLIGKNCLISLYMIGWKETVSLQRSNEIQ